MNSERKVNSLEHSNKLVRSLDSSSASRPAVIETVDSWKGLTPLEVAASRPASQYSKLNLEMVLLSGAKISISAAKKARDAKNAEALLIMGGWYQIRIRMGLS